jgi:SepF-like predicted cell division protein (DUF552 family)
MALDTQSNTIKDYAELNGTVAIFSSGGVDLYRKSFFEWVRVGFASLPNVTSGSFNNNGIWLGTSDRGVWHLPAGNGNLTSQLQQYYATAGTSYAIQSDNISHVAGNGSGLLVTHDLGAEYFPAPGVPFQYVDASGCGVCDLNDTYIAYAVSSGMHTLELPSSDWDSGDAIILTTGSSPALSSNTVNHLIYGLDDNLAIATGAGVDIYDYTDIVSLFSGNIPFVWVTSDLTQIAGDLAYVDSSADVHIYNIDTSSNVETHAGTFATCWIDSQADMALYNVDLELHAFISNISPVSGSRNVTRSWSFYFEIGDTINGISSTDITLKINGGVVSPTITAFGSGFSNGFSNGFGGEGFAVTYTPPSASGYRKTVTFDIIGIDGAGDTFTESGSFTTETALNESPTATKPPNVIVYKDLSLTDAEDTYNSVEVNWLDEQVTAYIVTESQAEAMATVLVENGIYHKYIHNMRVLDIDDSSNATQDINKGDIITIDVPALNLTGKKCEVLAKQRVVNGDRIEYNIIVAYYVVWS